MIGFGLGDFGGFSGRVAGFVVGLECGDAGGLRGALDGVRGVGGVVGLVLGGVLDAVEPVVVGGSRRGDSGGFVVCKACGALVGWACADCAGGSGAGGVRAVDFPGGVRARCEEGGLYGGCGVRRVCREGGVCEGGFVLRGGWGHVRADCRLDLVDEGRKGELRGVVEVFEDVGEIEDVFVGGVFEVLLDSCGRDGCRAGLEGGFGSFALVCDPLGVSFLEIGVLFGELVLVLGFVGSSGGAPGLDVVPGVEDVHGAQEVVEFVVGVR